MQKSEKDNRHSPLALHPYHLRDPPGSNRPGHFMGARGYLSRIVFREESHDMLSALFPTLLAALPTGPGAALAITAAALTYVITQRDIDAKVRIR